MADRIDTLLGYHDEDPEDGFVRFAIASEYRKLGRDQEALSWLEGLLRDQPEYVGAYLHLGRLYLQLGRRADAVTTFENGIRCAADQDDFHARSELQSALADLDLDLEAG